LKPKKAAKEPNKEVNKNATNVSAQRQRVLDFKKRIVSF
jgi:hypothetical protein